MANTIKLGDAATFVNGFPFKPETWTETGLPIIRIQNLNNPEAPFNHYSGPIPEKYVVRQGDILISWSASLGAYEWKGEDAYLNQHIFKVVFDKCVIDKHFLRYAVESKLAEMEKDAHGATMRHIVKKDFDNTLIPYPSIAEQEKIVAELDCLTGIIEKKKQQLEELDKLAQSIFYDMFGDPITNEKGWKVRRLGECFPYMKNGANIKQERGAGGIPITRIETLSGGVFNRDRLGYANILSVGKYDKNVLNDGDILMSHINSKAYIGRAVVYHKVPGETIIHGMNLLRLIAESSLISPVFAEMFFKTDYFKEQIASIRKDAVNQSSVATGDLKALKVVLPPLDLQNGFAQKIEAIEKQKELVKQSIVETETLFNSRMDFWFNN